MASVHVLPLSIENADIRHGSMEQIHRIYFQEECAACRASLCWQRTEKHGLGEVIIHGLPPLN